MLCLNEDCIHRRRRSVLSGVNAKGRNVINYTVQTFTSAADILASRFLPETTSLITDANMPGLTGVSAAQAFGDPDHPRYRLPR
jgi:FixJ family two-component response regulator